MTAYLVSIGTYVALFMVLALALNLQWGMAGMVNFGIAGFYAIGAYVSAVLTGTFGWPFIGGFAAACLAGLVTGSAVSLLSARLGSHYLAIVTLGFAEIVRLVALNEGWLTRGPKGLPVEVRPLADRLAPDSYAVFYLGLVLCVLAVTFVILEIISRSPYGRLLRAIREDDMVARSLGKNVLLHRVQAFALGSMFMGAAGSLYAHYIQNISPDHFTPMLAIFIWMAVVAGGAGNNVGLLLGAGVLMMFLEGTRFLGNVIPFLDAERLASIRIILIGSALILVLRIRPEGMLPERQVNRARRPARGREQGTPHE